MVGFGEDPQIYAQYLQSKWIGGKKNDLVLCFGGGDTNKPATWSYVFGWTNEGIVKKNLQTLLLTKPINDDIIPDIKIEVAKNYKIKEWRDFDYLEVPIPSWIYWLYPIILTGSQVGLYFFFHKN